MGIKLNKEYQTSDWRIRPFPLQMIDYARQDAAVLLFLFPLLMSRLIKERRVVGIIQEMNRSCFKNIQKSKLVLVHL